MAQTFLYRTATRNIIVHPSDFLAPRVINLTVYGLTNYNLFY